jgi:hypothetical protein
LLIATLTTPLFAVVLKLAASLPVDRFHSSSVPKFAPRESVPDPPEIRVDPSAE